jgi:hypothetical protein
MPRKAGPGRKPLPVARRRTLISARVAPETAKYFRKQEVKLGSLLDQWVREKLIAKQAEIERIKNKPACETLVLDEEDGSDVIMEQARGLLAMIAERGTSHLSEEQIGILSTSFEVLINNYLATFKKRPNLRRTVI